MGIFSISPSYGYPIASLFPLHLFFLPHVSLPRSYLPWATSLFHASAPQSLPTSSCGPLNRGLLRLSLPCNRPAPGTPPFSRLSPTRHRHCGNYVCQLSDRKNLRGGAQALSINPVRSSLDTGLKLFVMKRGAFLRRAVATLGAALNDTSGAVSFAARRTTNEEPPK